MDKARSSQLFPLTNMYWRNSWSIKCCTSVNKFDRTWRVSDSEKKTIVVFLTTATYSFLAPLMDFTLTGLSNQHRIFPSIFTIYGLTMCNLHFSYRPINIQRPMRMYSDIRYQRLQNLVWMFFQRLLLLTSIPPFPKQWKQRGQAWKLKHVVYV